MTGDIQGQRKLLIDILSSLNGDKAWCGVNMLIGTG